MSTLARQIIGEDEDQEQLRRLARAGIGLPSEEWKVFHPFVRRMREYVGWDLDGSTSFSGHTTGTAVVRDYPGQYPTFVYWRGRLIRRPKGWVLSLELHSFPKGDELRGTTEGVQADAMRFAGELGRYVKIHSVEGPVSIGADVRI